MSKAFYPKMALSNINKNRQTYFPYIITCILTIMMYFMMGSILHNENVRNMNHGDMVIVLLNIGMWVTMIFAVVFLFYTNSFLIKRRQKEIGLYNILGMEKRHIAKMMFYETLFTAVVSIGIGMLMGMLFGKLMFLLLIKLIGSSEIPAFQIPSEAVVNTLVTMALVFFAILLYNLARIHLTKPIELIHGGQIGEKEPKTKILLTIIGVLTMGAGYTFALTAKTLFQAMNNFLVAVILVIVGTYCLFTAGSIAFIKLLRKNKKFYYQTKHFTSVSGMLYRMKQNAVGLANICILSTMVLISVSTTVSMYLGMEDTLNTACPNEINLSASFYGEKDTDMVENVVDEMAKKYGATTSNYSGVSSITLFCNASSESGEFQVLKQSNMSGAYMDNLSGCLCMTVDDFNKLEKSNYKLNEGQVIVYKNNGYKAANVRLSIDDETSTFKVAKVITKLENAHLGIENTEQLVPCYVFIVDSEKTLEKIVDAMQSGNVVEKRKAATYDYVVQFDTNLTKEQSIAMSRELDALDLEGVRIVSDNRYEMAEEFHQMYGGFLFIGMFVGSLFLMATVLIIYYKQISEGYEDKARFEIMQKVGMSRAEVKKTIRSQVLMVFFIPLIMAAIHIVVSFRIIKMILSMLNLGNVNLFMWCTLGTVLVFCVIYAIVFAITERAYYKIVSIGNK